MRTLMIAMLAVVPALAFGETVEMFNGKDLAGWKARNGKEFGKWKVGRASLDTENPGKLKVGESSTNLKENELINFEPHSVDIVSEKVFGDCTVELELMVPKGSNSGVYLCGEYEVQVLDSFGKEKVGPGDLGGVYNNVAPKTNAAKKPGEWQKLEIEFKAPRFEDGRKIANAIFVKVTLNGTVIHENSEAKGSTGGGLTGKDVAKGPLMFQGDHGAVSFRNIKVTPK